MSGGRSICPLRPRSRSGHNTGVHRSAENALQVPVLFYGPLRDMGSSRLLSPPYSVAEEMKKTAGQAVSFGNITGRMRGVMRQLRNRMQKNLKSATMR